MNRKDFGKLIRALRREHRNEDYRVWTQDKLAHKAGLSKRTIERLETGTLVKLDSKLLLNLAEALELTSGERREFFLAASGVEHYQMAKRDVVPEDVLAEVIDRAQETYLPAYIIDSYCNVIASNSATLHLLDLEAAGLTINQMIHKPFGLNMLQFVFSPTAVSFYRKLMGRYWHNYAYQNMMIFRTLSLQYRSTTYFRNLLAQLMQYKYFKRYWRELYWEEQDHLFDNEHIRLNSRRWGSLVYFSTSYIALTTSVNLYFCVYVPITSNTAECFNELLKQFGASMHQFMRWPPDDYLT